MASFTTLITLVLGVEGAAAAWRGASGTSSLAGPVRHLYPHTSTTNTPDNTTERGLPKAKVYWNTISKTKYNLLEDSKKYLKPYEAPTSRLVLWPHLQHLWGLQTQRKRSQGGFWQPKRCESARSRRKRLPNPAWKRKILENKKFTH